MTFLWFCVIKICIIITFICHRTHWWSGIFSWWDSSAFQIHLPFGGGGGYCVYRPESSSGHLVIGLSVRMSVCLSRLYTNSSLGCSNPKDIMYPRAGAGWKCGTFVPFGLCCRIRVSQTHFVCYVVVVLQREAFWVSGCFLLGGGGGGDIKKKRHDNHPILRFGREKSSKKKKETILR